MSKSEHPLLDGMDKQGAVPKAGKSKRINICRSLTLLATRLGEWETDLHSCPLVTGRSLVMQRSEPKLSPSPKGWDLLDWLLVLAGLEPKHYEHHAADSCTI